MITYTGRRVDIPNPRPGQIAIEDVAHHLSRLPRFAGATQVPWCVAAHSLHCASLAERQGLPAAAQLYALLHDAHEAYMSDIPSPFKRAVAHPLAIVEDALQHHVLGQLGCKGYQAWHYQVKQIDLISLATERRDLMHPAASADDWACLEGIQPDTRVLNAVSPASIDWAHEFQQRYHQLVAAVSTTNHGATYR